jgi:hypothetical protein
MSIGKIDKNKAEKEKKFVHFYHLTKQSDEISGKWNSKFVQNYHLTKYRKYDIMEVSARGVRLRAANYII